MEYVFYMACIVFLILAAKRLFFAANHKEEDDLQEEPEIQKIVAEVEEQKEEREEIFYEINTHAIKISLYPSSTFSSYTMINLYKKIIVNNYWIDEPFHSSFVKMLYCVGENDFWIQSLKSKEIIINFRNFDGEEQRDTAMRVFDLEEILSHIVLEIDLHAHAYISKQCMQILLLSSMIYTISKCGNLDILINKQRDDLNTWILLSEIFCRDFSQEIKNKIIPINNLNIGLIQKIYDSAVQEAIEYPNHLNHDDSLSKEIKMLQSLQQKRLMRVQDY